VLSQDSDSFAYDSVQTVWRPGGKRGVIKVLEYNKLVVLVKVGLSSSKLTALACVSKNDYNKNVPSMDIATNYGIMKNLPDAGKNENFACMFIVDIAIFIIPSSF
jgi:hypothetical protein